MPEGQVHNRMSVGKLSTTECMKLLVLRILQNPGWLDGVAYPQPAREPKIPVPQTYREAFKRNGGLTGQELMDLINHRFLKTEWQILPDMMYNYVLRDLADREITVAKVVDTPRRGMNKVWYRLNDQPDASPSPSDDRSRPADRMVENRKANLAPSLRDAKRFLDTIVQLCYNGDL